MNKILIFFCCASAILLFTIINLNIGPIISKKVGYDNVPDLDPDSSSGSTISFYWGNANCDLYSDLYDKAKKTSTDDNVLKYREERAKYECQRKKGMHDMEYTSFILNMAIGFICGLLGLLHIFDVKKEFLSKTGLIGLVCGFIGFIFSFIYDVYNGIVYTNYYDYNNMVLKRDSDGAFAEIDGNFFECFYHDSPENIHSLYAKYSDLIQKQYNYNKNLIDSYSEIDPSCKTNPLICLNTDKIDVRIYPKCTRLFVNSFEYEITNQDISNRFLTALLLSLFVCIANIGLIIFGFLLFKNPKSNETPFE